jgi:hypothetical protein
MFLRVLWAQLRPQNTQKHILVVLVASGAAGGGTTGN